MRCGSSASAPRVSFTHADMNEGRFCGACHGRGAVHMFPGTRTVLDMGGQDSKAIRVKEDGEIVDFCMNDKCAAGTGRFLGAAAKALGMTRHQLYIRMKKHGFE